jgi:hypothetical protein
METLPGTVKHYFNDFEDAILFFFTNTKHFFLTVFFNKCLIHHFKSIESAVA